MASIILQAGAIGRAVVLNWTTPELPSPVIYEVDRKDVGVIGTTTVPSYKDTPPSDGEWTYQVTAMDGYGIVHLSDPVTVIVDTSTPDTPEVTLLLTTPNVAMLTWEAVPTAVKYEVVCNGELVSTVEADPEDPDSGLQYVHLLEGDGVYVYQVRAMNEDGRWSSFSSQAVNDVSPPSTPV